MATTVDRVLVQHADQEAIMLPLIRLSNLLAAGTLAGCLCLVGAGLTTFRGHFPLNAQISAWSIASPPTDWLQVQRQWTTFHHARVALVLVGFGLLALRTVLPRRGSD